MNVVGKFEKVSFGQFLKDFQDTFSEYDYENPEIIKGVKNTYDNIKLPHRSTMGSAGYDIVSTESFTLDPGETIKFPLGIKCQIDQGWVLVIVPRSSVGFKYGISLANTIAIIDADYYNNEKNEGHIFIKIRNNGDKKYTCYEGDAIAQGILLPFGVTTDDECTAVRVGGIGSTGV